jgi:hypothetical protein
MNIHGSQDAKRLMMPIIAVEAYLFLIMGLFYFGPWKWAVPHPVLLFLFLLGAQLSLFIGYVAILGPLSKREIADFGVLNERAILKFLRIAIIPNLLLIILYTIRNTGMASLSLRELAMKIVLGIVSPLKQYNAKFSEAQFGGRLLTYSITLFSPLMWPVIPLSIIYFKKLGGAFRVLSILTIILEASRWVATGTNKGVIDLVLTFVFLYFIKSLQRGKALKKPSAPVGKAIIMTLLAGFLALGVLFFLNNIEDRLKGNWILLMRVNNNTRIDESSPLMSVLPGSMKSLLVYMCSYLNQGYYGLSLAFDMPFTPMFGLGNSAFLIENVYDFFKVDLTPLTLQAKMAYTGWNPMVNWHSFYAWVANDVSLIGCLPVMFVIGAYFGILSFYSIRGRDPLASIMLCMLLSLFFYIPMNNQIFSSPITFMAFWFITAFWLAKRRIVKI